MIMKKQNKIILLIIPILFLFSSCNLSSNNNSASSGLVEAEVVFQVTLPTEISTTSGVILEILDEVTGLAFNPIRYQMQPVTPKSFFVRVNLPLNSVVKYRFSRLDNIAIPEYSPDHFPIRYRLYKITGPAVIQDSVAAWMDQSYSGETGRIQGRILDEQGNPVSDLLVSICGLTGFTVSDGTYQIENILPGTHNLLAMSPTGSYSVFQQGAVIAINATTPADFIVSVSPFANITFVVNLPTMDYSISPVRLIGNLVQLGNTFQDLDGGFSVLPTNTPTMGKLSEQQYAVTLSLPAGTYIEYKYSLGDGFWNAEHSSNGSFVLHKFIVPNKDSIITDHVENWGKGTNAPITFTVQVQANLSPSDYVSIQFNPFAWTIPIPMWNMGNNIWSYVLYSPLDIDSQLSYRYCRSNLCGSLDTGSLGTNFSSSGKGFTPSPSLQSITDIISE
jgi:hypothetical protein